MALPAVHVKVPPDLAERRLRQVSAWLILYLLLQAELGLAWDRQWHDLVGRDQFWIPPHIMIYTGIGAAGLIALGLVLIDTFRYRRKAAGVDDTSTIGVLWLFHAPLGFVLLGFGTLIDLLAAPFDNYWHQLYGIDVTLCSPFHIMGTIGGIVAGLGLIYAFASEAVLVRAAGRQPAFNFTLALLPLLFLIFALLVDGVAYWQHRHSKALDDSLRGAWLLGVLLALPAVIVPAWIVQALMALAPIIPLPPIPPDVARVIELRWSDLPLTLLFTLAGGATTAALGAALGDIWYLSRL